MSAAREALVLDAGREIDRICRAIKTLLRERLHRWGAVVGLSGGIDSSVVAALCVRALGRERVFGLLMPDRESAPETPALGRQVVDALGIASAFQDITPILEACGCYRLRDEAVRSAVPDFGTGDRFKIVLPHAAESDAFRLYSVVVAGRDGRERRARLAPEAYRDIVAATNFKQRVRTMLEYHHADRRNYAVAGTPNRLEFDQGFFVKNGDGAADFQPIAHLYKLQVYQLAEALGVPEAIRARPPTTDTYSLPQSQAEFYFSLAYQDMDLALFAHDHGWSPAEVADALRLEPEQALRIYRDIEAKRRAAGYLHAPPLTVDDAVVPA